MFSTIYRNFNTLEDIMWQLGRLKTFELVDEQSHRELEAIAATLRACGIEWRFVQDEKTGKFEAVLK